MNRIIALIRPVMRDDVITALHQVQDFPGACMSEIKGVRRGLHQRMEEHREPLNVDFRNYVRFEIICPDKMTPILVETIRVNAYTGKPGDGKIFVSPVTSALRISNSQTGDDAL